MRKPEPRPVGRTLLDTAQLQPEPDLGAAVDVGGGEAVVGDRPADGVFQRVIRRPART
jgi:hypothetical protein